MAEFTLYWYSNPLGFSHYIGKDFRDFLGNRIVSVIGKSYILVLRDEFRKTHAFLTLTIRSSVVEIYDLTRNSSSPKGTGKILLQNTVAYIRRYHGKQPIWLGFFEPGLLNFYQDNLFRLVDYTLNDEGHVIPNHHISPLGYFSERPFVSMFYNDDTFPTEPLTIPASDLIVYQSNGIPIQISFKKEEIKRIETKVIAEKSESSLLFHKLSAKEASYKWDGKSLTLNQLLEVYIKSEGLAETLNTQTSYYTASASAICKPFTDFLIIGHTHNKALYGVIGGKDHIIAPPSKHDYFAACENRSPANLIFAVEGIYSILINKSIDTHNLKKFLDDHDPLLQHIYNTDGSLYKIKTNEDKMDFLHKMVDMIVEEKKQQFAYLAEYDMDDVDQRKTFMIQFIIEVFSVLGNGKVVRVNFYPYSDKVTVTALVNDAKKILNAGYDDSSSLKGCFIPQSSYKVLNVLPNYINESANIGPLDGTKHNVPPTINIAASFEGSPNKRYLYSYSVWSLFDTIVNELIESLTEYAENRDNFTFIFKPKIPIAVFAFVEKPTTESGSASSSLSQKPTSTKYLVKEVKVNYVKPVATVQITFTDNTIHISQLSKVRPFYVGISRSPVKAGEALVGGGAAGSSGAIAGGAGAIAGGAGVVQNTENVEMIKTPTYTISGGAAGGKPTITGSKWKKLRKTRRKSHKSRRSNKKN